MSRVTISFSPGVGGDNFITITAEGETHEVDSIIEAIDKLKQHYPAPKPAKDEPQAARTVFPTR